MPAFCKGNLAGQVAKGVGMGLLTLGMYYQSPISANSTIYTMIVDAKENNIAFYKKSSLNNKKPNNSEVIKKQVEKIFEGYF